MTAIAPYVPTALPEQMEYARIVSASSLIPTHYRGKPADVLIAVQLGAAMGLTPAESLYRIDVIQGKPTAAAELIAANVRKAGHRLRLDVDEAGVSATCVIVRADDPEFEHRVTRDEAWAKRMGLLSKDNYKKQPATMLGWRAVTACARMACPEALYGVGYTPDEMRDHPRQESPGGLAGVLRATPVEPMPDPVEDGGAPESPHLDPKSPLARRMFATLNEAGVPRDEVHATCSKIIDRTIGSSHELTDADAEKIIDTVTAWSRTDDDPAFDPETGEVEP